MIKMKLMWGFILFELFPFCMCVQTRSWKTSATGVLESTFNYNFTHLPSFGQVLVWQMSEKAKTFEPQIYYQSNIPKFQSSKTYLLFLQKWARAVCIYYWIGSAASLIVKKSAAKYALLQYLLFKECHKNIVNILISREEEFIESESFLNTISFVDRNATQHVIILFYYQYLDIHLPPKLPNLYIIRGLNTSRIKAVPVGTQWFINDACFILETGYKVEELNPVNLHCGPNASSKIILRSKGIIRTFYDIYNAERQRKLGSKDTFKAILEVMENNDNYRSHEVDNSNDHLKDADTFVAECDRNVSFHRIYQNEMKERAPALSEGFSTSYYSREIFGKYGSHLFDSASIAGLFLYMHNKANKDEKLKGLEMAEDYLHNKYSLTSKPTRLRITEVYENIPVHIDLVINFINFPTDGLNEGEHW